MFASIASESYSFALDEALRLGLPVLAPDRSAGTRAVLSMEAHATMMEKIYDDATTHKRLKRAPSTPYLKLIAQVREQVGEREAALAGLQGLSGRRPPVSRHG